jgi:hypothetical protein
LSTSASRSGWSASTRMASATSPRRRAGPPSEPASENALATSAGVALEIEAATRGGVEGVVVMMAMVGRRLRGRNEHWTPFRARGPGPTSQGSPARAAQRGARKNGGVEPPPRRRVGPGTRGSGMQADASGGQDRAPSRSQRSLRFVAERASSASVAAAIARRRPTPARGVRAGPVPSRTSRETIRARRPVARRSVCPPASEARCARRGSRDAGAARSRRPRGFRGHGQHCPLAVACRDRTHGPAGRPRLWTGTVTRVAPFTAPASVANDRRATLAPQQANGYRASCGMGAQPHEQTGHCRALFLACLTGRLSTATR